MTAAEMLLRFGVAVLVVGGATLIAWRRTRIRRFRPGEAPAEFGPFPTALLFSSETCTSCPPARTVVEEVLGDRYTNLRWPVDTIMFHKMGVGRVPATLLIDKKGQVADVFEGVPQAARLRRAAAKLGL